MSNSSDSIFKLDEEFIAELHARLVETEKTFFGGIRELDELQVMPSVRQLEEIISTVFWASLQFEEGRSLRFKVTYGDACPFEHLSFVFDFPKPFTVEELRRLAPAVPTPEGHIGVGTFFGGDFLSVWGLQTTSMTGITFEALEPGRLIVSFPLDSKIAEITGQKSGFISQNWNDAGRDLMSICGADFEQENSQIEQMMSMLGRDVAREILSRVRALRHGGTIIFVSEGERWRKSVEKPVAYDMLRRFKGIPRVAAAYLEELRRAAANKDAETARKAIVTWGVNLLNDYQYKAALGAAAESIAHLTVVDGAVILDKNYEVLAFGAKIKESQKGRKAKSVSVILPFEGDPRNADSRLNQEFRGKRHLSTARFVLSNPDSIAFTVSQDGGVTGFVINDGKLLAYRGLELLL